MLKSAFKLPSYSYGLVDQAIISLSNFLLSILILRFLGIEIFGVFSFFWIFVQFMNSVQLSYIISPMLTNAPKQKNSNINYFYGGIFLQQLIFSSIIFFLVFFILKNFGKHISSYSIANYYLSFSLLIFITQLHNFLRRLLYSKKLYIRAIISDFITYFSLINFIIYLEYLNKLNLGMIFWSIFIFFLIGSIIILPIVFSLNYKLSNTSQSIRENWNISKWMLLTSLAQFFSGNLWVINAGIILGPFVLGIIKACQTLLGITNLILQSLENFIPGETSRKFISGSIKEMNIYLKKFALKGFLAVSVITFFVIIFSEFLLKMFYGAETASHYQVLMFISFTFPLAFILFPLVYGLRTLGKTKPIFISFLLSSIFAILGSNFIITYYEIKGVIAGLLFSNIITASYTYYGYRYYLKKEKL